MSEPHLPALPEEDDVAVLAAVVALREERGALVRRCAGRYRSALEWARIRTPEDYDALLAQVEEELASGQFWLARIGLVAEAAPELVLTLSLIRQQWLREFGAATVAQKLLVDQAMIGLYHQLRLHELIGNVQAQAEQAYFGGEPLRAVGYDRQGVRQYEVETHLRTINERLLVGLQRCQHMILGPMRVLLEMQRPSVTIHNEGQVNMAQQQVNIGKTPRRARRPRHDATVIEERHP